MSRPKRDSEMCRFCPCDMRYALPSKPTVRDDSWTMSADAEGGHEVDMSNNHLVQSCWTSFAMQELEKGPAKKDEGLVVLDVIGGAKCSHFSRVLQMRLGMSLTRSG
jgi:hypothetical protein